jgi:hypothetical protein
MPAHPLDRKFPLPYVITHLSHRRFIPLIRIVGPEKQHCPQVVVTVGEDIRRHYHIFSFDALGGIAASFDLRMNAFDNDPFSPVGRYAYGLLRAASAGSSV